jgi:hypothetical protein
MSGALRGPSGCGRVHWSEAMTDRLVSLYRAGADYAQIAEAIGLPKEKVRSKASALRTRGILEKGHRRPPMRAAPRPRVWDPKLVDEVIALRKEGRYRKEIRAETGLSEAQLQQLLVDLRDRRGPVPRGKRMTNVARRAGAPRILCDERVREVHAAYVSGESIVRLAAESFVSVRFLYGRFQALELRKGRTKFEDRAACERALSEAHEAVAGGKLSWHRYESVRREHPEWPGAGIVASVLGEGSWQAAKDAVGLDLATICERALSEAREISDDGEVTWGRYEQQRRDRAHWPSAPTVSRVLGGGSWRAAKRSIAMPASSAPQQSEPRARARRAVLAGLGS